MIHLLCFSEQIIAFHSYIGFQILLQHWALLMFIGGSGFHWKTILSFDLLMTKFCLLTVLCHCNIIKMNWSIDWCWIKYVWQQFIMILSSLFKLCPSLSLKYFQEKKIGSLTKCTLNLSHIIPANPPAPRGRLPRNGPISHRAYASQAGGYNLRRSDFSSSKSPAVKIYAKCHVNGRYFLCL